MTPSENIKSTFCNDGESVSVLARKLSHGDIKALNKAADMLVGNLVIASSEQATFIPSTTARKIGNIAANGSARGLVSMAEGQAIQAGLF